MRLGIFNTLTKQIEAFKPKIPGKVGMYVCGIRPYDFSHLGHARIYVTFDVLYRYLQHLGYKVTYVRNFTDVDDKIIHNGCGYAIDGDVYFSVDKFSGYRHLCGNKLEDIRAGVGDIIDPRKRHPSDFALWKSAKPNEPSWDSPWGLGRPGWHIQCSAMGMHYLSPSFDIHGGGKDLIFPHHENEITQSCAACSRSNVRYWMHTGFFLNKSKKLSKSTGNFITIREVLRLYHPLALRFFLIHSLYRSLLEYSSEKLEDASDQVFNIYQALYDCEMALSPFRGKSFKDEITPCTQKCIGKLRNCFRNSMACDLYTYPILEALRTEAMKTINIVLNSLKKNQQQPSLIQSLIALEKEVKDILNILGLMSSSTYSEVLKQLKDKAVERTGLTEDQLLQLIEERTSARNKEDEEFHQRISKYYPTEQHGDACC